MSQYSITSLFVATTGTIATTGGPQNLPGGEIGVFSPTYAALTNGTIAGNAYVYIAEGRFETVTGLGSKRSDRIAPGNVIEWYKVPALSNIPVQISTINNFSLICGEQVTFTFVLHSSYIDTGFFNGLTRSVTINTACCNCGTAPCSNLLATDYQNFVLAAVQALQADPLLSQFLTFQGVYNGFSSSIVVTELPLTIYGQPCDVAADPYEWDRLWFRAFVQAGPVTTQDFEVLNSCSVVGTVTVNQRSLFDVGSSYQIQQLEKNFYSFQTNKFKSLFRMAGYNEAFVSYVTPGQYYDTYYIKFLPYIWDRAGEFTDATRETETVIIAFPTTTAGTFETMMTTYLGAPTNWVSTNPTTTTTTSTTSTSTTSTTTLFP